jgi:hypothetical protein
MGKVRGKYRRSLIDENTSIPKQTRFSQSKFNTDEINNTSRINNLTQQYSSSNKNNLSHNYQVSDEQIYESNDLSSINEIQSSDINKELCPNEILQPSDELQIYNEFVTNEAPLQDFEQLINNGIVDDDLLDYDENPSSFFKEEEITKEELSAAFMAAFYNGRSTQSSLADYLKLANIFSPIKIPTTFDGLKRLIQGKTTDLDFNKTWFCGTCLKMIKILNNRFQRTCDVCKTRLNMYYN